MKRMILLYGLLCFTLAVFGQTGRLTGTVLDSASRTPMELATISILGQDSSLLTYGLADRNGRFLIEKLPVKKKLLVSVSYSGYRSWQTSLQFESGRTDTLTVFLSVNLQDTQAIVVT